MLVMANTDEFFNTKNATKPTIINATRPIHTLRIVFFTSTVPWFARRRRSARASEGLLYAEVPRAEVPEVFADA